MVLNGGQIIQSKFSINSSKLIKEKLINNSGNSFTSTTFQITQELLKNVMDGAQFSFLILKENKMCLLKEVCKKQSLNCKTLMKSLRKIELRNFKELYLKI